MTFAPGDDIAGYTVARMLGAGGMGEVYLAKHPRLPRHDAIKVLPFELSSDTEYRDRFALEADLASSLWHPHIVGVHDRGEAEGQLWIAMDFVDGSDASALLQRQPHGLPVRDVVAVVTAIADALDYAHGRNLLHRDVKPANIMLTASQGNDSRRILLADFGVARAQSDAHGLTATNMTVGTVAYAAPEQLLGEAMDGRADQYALAATAYHLLSGAPVFAHSNPAVTISRHLNASPPSLADSRPELAALDPVLAVALAKEPAERFARCADFAAALVEAVSADSAVHQAPTQVRPAAPSKAGREANRVAAAPRRPRSAWALAAAIVGAVAVAVSLAAWRPWALRGADPAAMIETPTPSLTRLTTPPPLSPSTPSPAPLFPAAGIDDVLLSAGEVNALVGTADVETTVGRGLFQVDETTYGPSDNSRLVTPSACVGLVFGAEYSVWGGSGYEEIRDQTFSPYIYAQYDRTPTTPTDIEQTVAVFGSIKQSQAFIEMSRVQWERCAGGEVRRDFVEGGYTFTVGSTSAAGDLISVPMAAVSGLNGAIGCRLVLGVRDNVVVSVRSCVSPGDVPGGDGGLIDLSWADDDAERLAEAMLAKVVT